MTTVARNAIHEMMDDMNDKNPFADSDGIPDTPKISENCCSRRAPILSQLTAIQRTIASLEYNYLPSTFFSLKKGRPLNRILSTAKEIVTESLPIRCLEATFLALQLTQHLSTVDRIPMSFKSFCGNRHYRHIVLVIRFQNCYGTLGLSRSQDLMDKPMTYSSLADLLEEFRLSYLKVGHRLASFKLGLPIDHNGMSRQVPCWQLFSVTLPVGAKENNYTPGSPMASAKKQPERPADGETEYPQSHDFDEVTEEIEGEVTPPRGAAARPIPEITHVNALLVKYAEMMDDLTADFQTLAVQPKPLELCLKDAARAAKYGDLGGTYHGAHDDDEDDDANGGGVSDCEENQFRVRCLMTSVSPFHRLRKDTTKLPGVQGTTSAGGGAGAVRGRASQFISAPVVRGQSSQPRSNPPPTVVPIQRRAESRTNATGKRQSTSSSSNPTDTIATTSPAEPPASGGASAPKGKPRNDGVPRNSAALAPPLPSKQDEVTSNKRDKGSSGVPKVNKRHESTQRNPEVDEVRSLPENMPKRPAGYGSKGQPAQSESLPAEDGQPTAQRGRSGERRRGGTRSRGTENTSALVPGGVRSRAKENGIKAEHSTPEDFDVGAGNLDEGSGCFQEVSTMVPLQAQPDFQANAEMNKHRPTKSCPAKPRDYRGAEEEALESTTDQGEPTHVASTAVKLGSKRRRSSRQQQEQQGGGSYAFVQPPTALHAQNS